MAGIGFGEEDSKMERNRSSAVGDVAANSLAWLILFSVLSLLNGVVRERSVEVGFSEWWGFISTPPGAAIYVAGAIVVGVSVTFLHNREERRRKKQ
jgi:hypothetical protein